MPTLKEKVAFSSRLKLALRRIKLPASKGGEKKSIDGPTALALHMTLRHPGTPITPQAADKWLKGRAIPKKDKIATLAEWCGVDPHWLEYGPSPAVTFLQIKQVIPKNNGKPTPENIALAIRIQELLGPQRYVLEELVSMLEQTRQTP